MAANLAYQPSGLQSFALDENDIYEYEKSIGDAGGIADLGAIRERMEKLGRFGDDTLAHVETGELIVPKPLLDKMPELKESIFEHLREMGIEDPERYVVGSIDNSINPVTGSPEFFFKKVFRGIKKAVKSVAKVVKKVAPTLIKIGGTALLASIPGIGLPLAAAISSGIGTLVGGGSLTDALKSAAIGGATGYLAGPLGEVASNALGGAAQAAVAGGDASDILKGAGLGAAGAAADKIISPTLSDTALGRTLGMKPGTSLSEDLSKTGEFLGITDAAASGTGAGMSIDTTSSSPAADISPGYGGPPAADISPGYGGPPAAPTTVATTVATAPTTVDPSFGYEDISPTDIYSRGTLDQASDYLQQAYDYATTSETRFDANDVIMGKPNVSPEAAQDYKALVAKGVPLQSAAKSVTEKYAPGFFGANRPYVLAGGAALAAAAPSLMDALTEVPEMEKPDVLSDPRAAGPSDADIKKYCLGTKSLFPGVTPADERETLVAPTAASFGYSESLRRRFPELFAADGGGVFPRRTGGIMPDEGIPNKDSVKALVMPGEFIFTTKAVKGAGNGDLRRGINNMYSVMRNLEARGERMA